MASHLQMKEAAPVGGLFSHTGAYLADRPSSRRYEKQDFHSTKSCYVSISFMKMNGTRWTVRILTHKQPLRAGFAECTLATSSRTYGGCRPCHGSSKLRRRSARPKPPP
jgi:hypothetical protein